MQAILRRTGVTWQAIGSRQAQTRQAAQRRGLGFFGSTGFAGQYLTVTALSSIGVNEVYMVCRVHQQ